MLRLMVLIPMALFMVACQTFEREEDIPLDEVPAVVMKAAQGAVEGIVIKEAELETEDGVQVYELEGTANGKDYEIEVSPSGEVLEIEEDDGEESE